MSRPRAHLSLTTKLAAALLQMKRYVGDGEWELIISHEEAKTLTAAEIIARFHFDHYPIPHAEGGCDEPHNLEPVLVADHKEKTAKVDIPQIAKTKRIARAHQEMAERFCAKIFHPDLLKPKKKRSNFPAGRKIPSRPFNRKKERP